MIHQFWSITLSTIICLHKELTRGTGLIAIRDWAQLSPERSEYDEQGISSEHIHPGWQLWHQMKEPGFEDEPALHFWGNSVNVANSSPKNQRKKTKNLITLILFTNFLFPKIKIAKKCWSESEFTGSVLWRRLIESSRFLNFTPQPEQVH